MAFTRGVYARQENLPAPARNVVVGSRGISFAGSSNPGHGVYLEDAEGNPEPMSDTAQRVTLTVAFEAGRPGGNLGERDIASRKKRVTEALAGLVREGVIRDVRVLHQRVGAQLREEVDFYDVLRGKPQKLVSGPTWVDKSWTASDSGDGTVSLASWMSYSCATAGTTSQQSASTAQSGYAADTPRWFSRDGVDGGLLLEPGRENLFDNFAYDSSWTLTNGATITYPVTDPAGDSEAVRVIDDSGVDLEYLRGDSSKSSPGGNITHSIWMLQNGGGGSTEARIVDDGGFASDLTLVASTEDEWEHRQSAATGEPASTLIQGRLYPRIAAADTGTADFWGIQVEQGLYGTSFIDGTRAETHFALASADVAPFGYFDLEMTAPALFAHDEATGEHDWIHVDSDNRVYYDGADDSWHFVLHGTEVATVGATTFSRDQALTLRAKHLPTGCALTISGATTGDGTDAGSAQPRISPSKWIQIMGDADGTQEGVALQSITSRAA